MKKLTILFLATFILIGCTNQSNQSVTSSNLNKNLVRVSRVVDGDTVEIEGGQKVRYIGINTPETVDPRKPVECFGSKASLKNKELVEGKEVRLEKDVSETDQYGRFLRYVYVGNVFVNDYLVRQGYAQISTFPPDVKYQEQFKEAEKEARENNRGLWADCSLSTKSGIASPSVQATEPVTTEKCNIKGNISRTTGEKIYHLPGGYYYDKTVIGDTPGEKMFCSEEDAQKEGWRKSKR
ncbi:MAG: thermonuclease family protein [Patescibacteria group bacterium]|nr:thermonuclease family protein [Patescibacteria group bacterium]